MTNHNAFGVVILAGGEGRRIGGEKPLKLLCGKTLLERALTHARQWSDTVAVLVKSADQLGGHCGVTALCDTAGEGPLAGLYSALSFAEAQILEAILSIPCDVPLLPPDLLDRLASVEIAAGSAVVASSGGRLHPTISLWRLPGLRLVPSYVASGKSSMMGLLEQVGFATVDWPVMPYDPFLNVNSEEDLARAAGILGRAKTQKS